MTMALDKKLTRFRVHYLWRENENQDWREGKREVVCKSPESASGHVISNMQATGAKVIIGKVKVIREERMRTRR